jgi:hypothetical protein
LSLAPTSASGERSFKQRSRVHTKTRNRLGAGNADKSSAIIFNKRQNMRFYDGVLSQGRTSTVQKLIANTTSSTQFGLDVGGAVGTNLSDECIVRMSIGVSGREYDADAEQESSETEFGDMFAVLSGPDTVDGVRGCLLSILEDEDSDGEGIIVNHM